MALEVDDAAVTHLFDRTGFLNDRIKCRRPTVGVTLTVRMATAGLRELHASAPVVELPALGNYPQREYRDAFTEAALRLLAEQAAG